MSSVSLSIVSVPAQTHLRVVERFNVDAQACSKPPLECTSHRGLTDKDFFEALRNNWI